MLEFRKKRKLRRFIYSPIIVLIVAIIFVLLLRGTWGVYKKDRLTLKNLEQEKIELGKIELRQSSLEASLAYLSTERGIESEIRSKFRAVKEGEKVSVIVDERKIDTASSTTTKKGFWHSIFSWL